jgi:topoisomerase-4 subunit B
MAAKNKHDYDESKVKTLSSLEHIRLRTGMYIGRTGDGTHYEDGIYILVKEVVDNAVDEFIMGCGRRVDITLQDETVTVRDYGRGIPLGKVVDCVSRINTGAKYNDDVFQFSVGLNGVGTKAVNALSRHFQVRSYRGGKYVDARFERGRLLDKSKGSAPDEPDGTLIQFLPDAKIFGPFVFNEDHLAKRFRYYTYLNCGLEVLFNGKTFLSRRGLLDLIREERQFEKLYTPFHFRDKMLELAFTHTHRFNEHYYSFVNGQHTGDGGTHLSAFREGVLKGINEFAKKRFDGDDVREGIVGAVAIRLKEPVFESQTKNKLGNTEVRAPLVNRIRDVVLDLLHRNPESAEKLLNKIEETHKLRKELQSVKKMARQRAKAVSIRIPQLKDCKIHLDKKKNKGTKSSIFITEGQSAGGSLVSCRDVSTQAIFTLKGKPLNVCDLRRDAIYKNDEIYNLMRSLNIEESVDRLRYNSVVLATDADVDGMHIRNLLITFFLRFFETLVREGHLHILETPLFRVRNKKETRYCYSEDERDAALKKLARGAEVTRFKGLGEISPGEFKGFIGDDIRLTPVVVNGNGSVPEILSFYMGRNTQERREYIINNLILDETA